MNIDQMNTKLQDIQSNLDSLRNQQTINSIRQSQDAQRQLQITLFNLQLRNSLGKPAQINSYYTDAAQQYIKSTRSNVGQGSSCAPQEIIGSVKRMISIATQKSKTPPVGYETDLTNSITLLQAFLKELQACTIAPSHTTSQTASSSSAASSTSEPIATFVDIANGAVSQAHKNYDKKVDCNAISDDIIVNHIAMDDMRKTLATHWVSKELPANAKAALIIYRDLNTYLIKRNKDQCPPTH
jgi:hypothetical protein